jgi:hypothetical protein
LEALISVKILDTFNALCSLKIAYIRACSSSKAIENERRKKTRTKIALKNCWKLLTANQQKNAKNSRLFQELNYFPLLDPRPLDFNLLPHQIMHR